MQIVDVFRAVEHDNCIDLVHKNLVLEDFAIRIDSIVEEIVLDGNVGLFLDKV